MAVFALLCLVIGLAPQFAVRLVFPVLASFLSGTAPAFDPDGYSAILGRLSLLSALLLMAVMLVTLLWRWRMRQSEVTSASTWGCGFQRATARMEYTATAFSELAVSVFNGIIRQLVERPALKGVFPAPARCADQPTETVLERVIEPLFSLAGVSFAFLRRLQHGQMHIYMLYVFVTLFILMLWAH
jgi:hydrogenase-4 component B